jgi:hypothetical protein
MKEDGKTSGRIATIIFYCELDHPTTPGQKSAIDRNWWVVSAWTVLQVYLTLAIY